MDLECISYLIDFSDLVKRQVVCRVRVRLTTCTKKAVVDIIPHPAGIGVCILGLGRISHGMARRIICFPAHFLTSKSVCVRAVANLREISSPSPL